MTQIYEVTGVATKVYTEQDGTLCVKYHDTVVFRRYLEGHILLNAGRWKSATTKVRMNQALNQYGPRASQANTRRYSVFQKDFAWYVQDRETNTNIPFDDEELKL